MRSGNRDIFGACPLSGSARRGATVRAATMSWGFVQVNGQTTKTAQLVNPPVRAVSGGQSCPEPAWAIRRRGRPDRLSSAGSGKLHHGVVPSGRWRLHRPVSHPAGPPGMTPDRGCLSCSWQSCAPSMATGRIGWRRQGRWGRPGQSPEAWCGAGPGFARFTGGRSARPVPHIPHAAPRPLSCP